MLTVLSDGARHLGLNLNSDQLHLFQRYFDLLVSLGKRAGVTSVVEPEEVQRRHFLESLALAVALQEHKVLEAARSASVLDLGSGGGLPGVPVKLLLPQIRLTLLEANEKKSAFLRHVVTSLDLADAEVLTGRAEDAGRNEAHCGRYDLVLARAVAPLPALLELALPLLRVGGHLAALKGSRAQAELKASQGALSSLNGEVVAVTQVTTPYALHPQTLVLVRKEAETPSKYPRRAGIPQKRPLGEK